MESAVSASVNWHTKDRSLVLRKQVGRPKATWRGSVEPSAVSYTHLDVYKRQTQDRVQQELRSGQAAALYSLRFREITPSR